MKDKLNITIRIAGLAPIPLSINIKDEELIRSAEYNVNLLWTAWSQRFKDKSSSEILAMVAFQFAKLYLTLSAQEKATDEVLSEFEKELDNILLNVQ